MTLIREPAASGVFSSSGWAGHEEVVFCGGPGLRAIIAVHSTTRGPALGGCRVLPYPDDGVALTDVLRLSRGMSRKAAMAGLPFGGGKMVVLADPQREKTPELLRAVGRAVDLLGGRYVTGEDVGTTVSDMAEIARETPHVMGVPMELGGSGDPSPSTARGCMAGIAAAVRYRLGRPDLSGLRVAVQGLGNVGRSLCGLLAERGVELVVADVRPDRAAAVVDEFDAIAVPAEDLFRQDVDVVAPCALGAVIDDTTVASLAAPIVAGAANNQLADEQRHGAGLRERGILYAPDYVVNAGGMIQLSAERSGALDWADVHRRVDAVGDSLLEVFEEADRAGIPTSAAAAELADMRIAGAVR